MNMQLIAKDNELKVIECNLRVSKSCPRVLDTKGNDLETLRLHSMTLSSLSLAISCMFMGPETIKALAIALVIWRIFVKVSALISLGGVTSVASPECTPAFSTCSQTAIQTISPLQATASTSISFALLINLEMTTGCSLETSLACFR